MPTDFFGRDKIGKLTDDEHNAAVGRLLRLLIYGTDQYLPNLGNKILNDVCVAMLHMLHGKVKILKGEEISDAV